MDSDVDFFALFRLPAEFRVPLAELEERYREVQRAVHPDRFATASGRERRLSLQWSARINEAYQVLKTPLLRAKHLIRLAGHEIGAEDNIVMDAAFLEEQMEWRGAAAEARANRDRHALETLLQRLRSALLACYEALASTLDEARDYPAAASQTRQLMFLEKLERDINDALSEQDD